MITYLLLLITYHTRDYLFPTFYLHLFQVVLLHRIMLKLSNDSNSLCHSSVDNSKKTFSVILVGKTNGAHCDFVEKFKDDHTEVRSREECDYLLVFCPVASRVGTDIGEALKQVPGKNLWTNFTLFIKGIKRRLKYHYENWSNFL